MITVNELRSTFLKYFEKNGHKILPSSSLVPNNDPTLMFTNAGMVQFKNIFIGAETRDYKRATTSQKCVRAGGKHNDLDNVGYTVRHHTFFEMLGNFSFGDYFKEEAIKLAWDLVTKELDFPKERLVATVYHNDEDAYNLWKKIAGLSDSQLVRIATKDNFWQMGDTGPCGPCSEIFFDHGDKIWGGLPGSAEEDGDRYIEIWNNVFMQFEDLSDGSRVSLPKPSIDTGMGLERVAAILQGVHSNYEIDLFQNIISAIANMASSDPDGPLKSSHNVVADHLRSSCFLIADGVLPSNEGRGYVLRRIMRRAMRHLQLLGIKEPMMYKLLPTLQKEMGEAYPELYRANALIHETIKTEESKFIKTLEKGIKLLDEESKDLVSGDTFDGETAFKLYDTYGFPLDLTQDALKNKNISVDTTTFDKAMQRQKAEARKSWSGSGDAGVEKIWFELADKFGNTEFLGYHCTSSDAQIKALVQGQNVVNSVSNGEFYLISNQTPFYGESGGQVGDIGFIKGANWKAQVTDTKKKLDGLFVHCCQIINGTAKAEDIASFEVDTNNRNKIRANHSVTHLLHKVLREKLGNHVSQKGSMVSAERARFDISHHKQISAEDIKEIEKEVNTAIRANYQTITRLMTPQEAVETGAMALFGEKYGDMVRVISMEKDSDKFSIELCGGTHVNSTGEIGYFNIVSESAVAAGVRRIEFITGEVAEKHTVDLEERIHNLSTLLKTTTPDLEAKILQILDENKKQEQEIFKLKRDLLSGGENKNETEVINGVNFVAKQMDGVSAKELKIFVDEIKDKIKSGIICLMSCTDGKVSTIIGVTNDLVSKYSAVELVKKVAPHIGAQGGGGRADMAQTGGTDTTNILSAFEELRKSI